MTAMTERGGCIVGGLACQRDSYLRELSARVVACDEVSDQASGDSERLWQVEFNDSVLFPEGGGQPSDYGTLVVNSANGTSPDIPVKRIERHGLRCIIYSPQPLAVGDTVQQKVDSERRWDHMQQHTGQHLLSAVARNLYKIDTVGWGMGPDGALNYIDVPRKVSAEEIKGIQDACNEICQQNIMVITNYPEVPLNEDANNTKGIIRVVSIGEMDNNPCCGTHLSQTAHISTILIQSCQAVNASRHRLYFAAGNRAMVHANAAMQALTSLGKQLSCAAVGDDILAATDKLRQSASDAKKREKKLVLHIAKLEVLQALSRLNEGNGVWLYQPDAGPDLLNGIKAEMKTAGHFPGLLVVLVGGINEPCSLSCFGNEEKVQGYIAEAQKKIAELKGFGKGRAWQGKVAKLSKSDLEALETLVQYGPSK